MSNVLADLDKCESQLFTLLDSFQQLTNSATGLYDLDKQIIDEERNPIIDEPSRITTELASLNTALKSVVLRLPLSFSIRHDSKQSEDYIIEETFKHFQSKVQRLDALERERYL